MAGDIGVATLANGSTEIPDTVKLVSGIPIVSPRKLLTAVIEDESPPSQSGNASRAANVFDRRY